MEAITELDGCAVPTGVEELEALGVLDATSVEVSMAEGEFNECDVVGLFEAIGVLDVRELEATCELDDDPPVKT